MLSFFKFRILLVIIIFPAMLFPQIKTPVIEDVPDVEFNAAETTEKFKASVTLYGKGVVNGELVLNSGASIIPAGDSGRIYLLREINRITVIKWSGQRKGSGWVFYPDRYEIILKDKSRILYEGNLGFLNRLRFIGSEGGERALFMYFYDYYINGKWVNTGVSGEKTPPLNPAAGTSYIIELK
ncbi:MAG TPA: hypothetical protein P5120_12540 [Spirochaetota bacterium]|nr:hypothetical protein [Spirochaetota bacterium]HPF07297.1 hypothetical protein [Spirochaetota bacterium]HPJ42109.1 hypothetical protein [Spirochaetota bacterium]HPR38573.1 hypothetical protein [Spirochaetota bacterium]HRX48339.1 hypothetical protein [Spirochaetota bacterium]